jgi:hypothetical protein
LHREGEPAYIETREDGTIIQAYFTFGRLHREGEPAYIETRPDGTVISMFFKKNQFLRQKVTKPHPAPSAGSHTVSAPAAASRGLRQYSKEDEIARRKAKLERRQQKRR